MKLNFPIFDYGFTIKISALSPFLNCQIFKTILLPQLQLFTNELFKSKVNVCIFQLKFYFLTISNTAVEQACVNCVGFCK